MAMQPSTRNSRIPKKTNVKNVLKKCGAQSRTLVHYKGKYISDHLCFGRATLDLSTWKIWFRFRVGNSQCWTLWSENEKIDPWTKGKIFCSPPKTVDIQRTSTWSTGDPCGLRTGYVLSVVICANLLGGWNWFDKNVEIHNSAIGAAWSSQVFQFLVGEQGGVQSNQHVKMVLKLDSVCAIFFCPTCFFWWTKLSLTKSPRLHTQKALKDGQHRGGGKQTSKPTHCQRKGGFLGENSRIFRHGEGAAGETMMKKIDEPCVADGKGNKKWNKNILDANVRMGSLHLVRPASTHPGTNFIAKSYAKTTA